MSSLCTPLSRFVRSWSRSPPHHLEHSTEWHRTYEYLLQFTWTLAEAKTKHLSLTGHQVCLKMVSTLYAHEMERRLQMPVTHAKDALKLSAVATQDPTAPCSKHESYRNTSMIDGPESWVMLPKSDFPGDQVRFRGIVHYSLAIHTNVDQFVWAPVPALRVLKLKMTPAKRGCLQKPQSYLVEVDVLCWFSKRSD